MTLCANFLSKRAISEISHEALEVGVGEWTEAKLIRGVYYRPVKPLSPTGL